MAAKSLPQRVDRQRSLPVVDVDDRPQQLHVGAAGQGNVVQGPHVFREAGPAVADAGVDPPAGSRVHGHAVADGVDPPCRLPRGSGTTAPDEGSRPTSRWRRAREYSTNIVGIPARWLQIKKSKINAIRCGRFRPAYLLHWARADGTAAVAITRYYREREQDNVRGKRLRWRSP